MAQKMGPSKTFTPMDVEVEEIIERILEDGGIPSNKLQGLTTMWSMRRMMKTPSIQVMVNLQLLNLQKLQV